MKQIELKPCPFCGGKARFTTKTFDCIAETAVVYCEVCGAQTEEVSASVHYCAEEKAASLWNTRVDTDQVHCRDCVHWDKLFGVLGTCSKMKTDTANDNFCKYGER